MIRTAFAFLIACAAMLGLAIFAGAFA